MEQQLEYKPDYKLERWIALILTLFFLLPFIALAQEPEPELSGLITFDEVQQGTLLLKTDRDGLLVPAPTLHTTVEMHVNGMILRARVIQQFHNPASTCLEGIYVFPLPESAAVDQLHMTIGDRRIEGQIQEREEARRTYETAKSEGRKASLLEQQRPNVFTVSVASVLPDEKVVIEIEYQQVIDYRDGAFSLRFPMVVAPRYTSGERGAVSSGERGAVSGEEDEQGSPLSPQYKIPENFPTYSGLLPVPSPLTAHRSPLGNRSPLDHRSPLNAVQLRIELNAGMPLSTIDSSYHRVQTSAIGPDRYEIVLADGEVPADRDFELVWKPEIGREPKAAVFSETVGDESFALVMVVPPTAEVTPVRLPRETVYIIDTSGSMEGESMEQARDALLLALDGLRPGDTFNVVEFDSDVQVLFDQSQPADVENVGEAKRFVQDLQADGGTEMLPALMAALETASITGSRVRQVIFMTDGQVSNEEEIFQFLLSRLGSSRLFTVGIGSAPNSHFMRRAAQIGRGTFTYIGDLTEVKAKMGELFRKLDHPVLSDVRVQFEGLVSEAWPSSMPDLYLGEPLLVAVRLDEIRGGVSLQGSVGTGERGKAGLKSWSQSLSLSSTTRAAGIGKLWARRKIEALEDSVAAGADSAQVRSDIVATALRHHLVSQHTSLVAVDVTPTGLDAKRCKPQLLPMHTPRGFRDAQLPGVLPSTATRAELMLLIGIAILASGALWRIRQ